MKKTDYVLRETTCVYWPGVLPYRGERTAHGRGYPSREAALHRARRILAAYAARGFKECGPEFIAIERTIIKGGAS